MVANHPGMTDQTSSNIARDGAAKKTVTKFPVHPAMKNSQDFAGAGPSSPGSGPDASSPNVLDPTTKGKETPAIGVKWGMEKSPTTHSPELGSAVLKEAANLGR
jgi:hypothetical protein